MKPSLVLVYVALAALPLAARPLTAQDVVTRPRLGECQVSPDGKWLAVNLVRVDLQKNETVSELRIYPWPTSKSWPQPAACLAKAYRPRWSPDGSRLLFSGGDTVSQIFVCSSRDWIPQRLRGSDKGADGPVWAPDGRHIAFVASVGTPASPLKDSGRRYDELFLRRWNRYHDGGRLHLFLTEVGSSAPARDATPWPEDAAPTSGAFSSGDNYCFSADSRSLLFSAPPRRNQARDTNYDVYRLDLSSGRKSNLTSANPAADMGPRLSADGKRLYIVSMRRPGYESDFGRLRSVAVDASGSPSGEWRDEELNNPTGLGEFLPTAAGAWLTRLEGPSVRGYFRDSRGHRRPLNSAGSVYGLSSDSRSNRWAALHSSLTEPPRLLLGELHGGVTRSMEPLMALDKEIELGAVESVDVPVEGPSPMQMWLIKPPNFDPRRRYPVAYLIHGGPQGAWTDGWSLRWNAQLWAAQGYLVAMPNPRGSSGRTHEFQEEVSRDWGGRAYRDLMAGADYLTGLPFADRQRMVAAGASFGGYMVNWFAVNTGRFRALVTHCGIWNLESEYGTTDELWFADWELGGPPWSESGEMPPDYARFSPHRFAHRLAQFKTPHLVIHNDLDYRCPINQGLELFTALKCQGVEARFLNFPDEGHWVQKPRNSLRWYREVFAFLRQHA